MRHEHILIAESEVHKELRVYEVLLGESNRDIKSKSKLQANAAGCNDIYFQLYDCNVCDFLHSLACCIYPHLGYRDAWEMFYIQNYRQIPPSEAIRITSNYQSLSRKNLKL